MWDCPKCGTLNILGLSNCPTCGLARPEGAVSASVLPAADVSAAPDAPASDSLAGEDKGAEAATNKPEPQAPKKPASTENKASDKK